MSNDIVSHLQSLVDDPMWPDHAEVNKRTLTAAIKEIERLRLELGQTRLCLTCGKVKPSTEPAHEPGKGCEPDPEMGHICSFDATPQEAWQHWRQEAHRLRELNSKLTDKANSYVIYNARLEERLNAALDDAERWRWGVKHAAWYRSEERSHIAIPVAAGADLSCVATRVAAIDAARGAGR